MFHMSSYKMFIRYGCWTESQCLLNIFKKTKMLHIFRRFINVYHNPKIIGRSHVLIHPVQAHLITAGG